MTAAMEWRNGHVWCLQHNTWWKLCPCPGDVSARIEITKDVIERARPKPGAFIEAVRNDAR